HASCVPWHTNRQGTQPPDLRFNIFQQGQLKKLMEIMQSLWMMQRGKCDISLLQKREARPKSLSLLGPFQNPLWPTRKLMCLELLVSTRLQTKSIDLWFASSRKIIPFPYLVIPWVQH